MSVTIITTSEKKLKIVFLCTGNSCRSQIAQGWARHLKSDVIEAYSAGVAPASAVNHRAIEVMKEVGVDISGQKPKHINDLNDINFDYAFTLCGHAAETCPVFTRAKVIHNGFDDPSFMQGDEKEIMTAFRQLRKDIRVFIEKMPGNLK